MSISEIKNPVLRRVLLCLLAPLMFPIIVGLTALDAMVGEIGECCSLFAHTWRGQ